MKITITGTNRYGVKQRLDELAHAFIEEHGDLALEKLDGSEASYEQLLGAIESLPFLASKKMVVIYDLSTNAQAVESIEKLLERLPESTDLLLIERKLDKRSIYYKSLKKLTDFQEFNELDEDHLADWLAAEAETKKAKLSKSDARYLVQRVGTDQMRLGCELDKLISYNKEVSRNTIDLLVDESPTSTIFNLLDSAFSGDLSKATRLYREQRSLRIEPQVILAMLVWQMHAVAIVSSAPEGADPKSIAQDSGINPFVVQKSQRIAGKMDRAKIAGFMGLLRDIDYRSKREIIDYDEALQYALISLASK